MLRTEIARILQHDLKDPRIGFLSVLSVRTCDDLREAVVRVSLLGSPAEERTTMRGLDSARGYIQTLLAERCHLRHTPQLRFEQDESIRKGMDLGALIQKARSEDEARAGERGRRNGE